MSSKDWKFLVSAALTIVALAGCQNHSEDEQSAPSSKFQGLWLSHDQLEECHRTGAPPERTRPDAINIQGDGQVYRHTLQQNLADPGARQFYRIGVVTASGEYKLTTGIANASFGSTSGIFVSNDGNHIFLMDLSGRQQQSYARTTETQILAFRTELARCQSFAQNGPPPGSGGDPIFRPQVIDPRQGDPRLADPRLIDPRQFEPRDSRDPRLAGPRDNPREPSPYVDPRIQRQDGNWPPPPQQQRWQGQRLPDQQGPQNEQAPPIPNQAESYPPGYPTR